MFLANAFSLQMLDPGRVSRLEVTPVSVHEARSFVGNAVRDGSFVSAVGHEDTARILTGILEVPVPTARINVSLPPGGTILVAQVTGGRLPEGATTLPEGVRLQFFVVIDLEPRDG